MSWPAETAGAPGRSEPDGPRRAALWLGVTFAGALPVVALTWLGVNLVVLPLLLIAAIGGGMLLASTQRALVFTAFSIIPLGIIQWEMLSITVSLPEAIILALCVKELYRFFTTGEGISPMVPWRWLLLYLAASVVGVVTGLLDHNGPAAVLQDFRQFTEYAAFYLLVVHRVLSRRQVLSILAAFMLGGTLVGAHGILQHYTGIGIPGDQLLSDAIYHGNVRSGSFYGSTPLGAMMVLSLGPAIGLFLVSRRPVAKAFFLVVTGVLLTSAVFTQTRASWVAIALLLVIVFFSIKKGPGLVALAVGGALVFTILLGPIVATRMGKLTISKSERSLLERVHYYTAAYRIFQHAPVFGLGWGCRYDIDTILTNGRYVPVTEVTHPAHVHREPSTVHSAYLQLLVKSGTLGLGTFLLLIASWGLLMLRARRHRPREEADHALFISVAAALAAYLFHSGLENFFQWPVMSQSFWLLLGLTTVMAHHLVAGGRLDPPEEGVTP